GDMMSLLLTFFIMLVALSEVNGDARYKETVESIMRYMGFHVAPVSRPGDDPALNEVIEKLRMLATANDGSRGGAGLFAGADLRVLTGREGTSIHAGQAL